MEQLRALAWGYEADGAPREDLRSGLDGDPDAGGTGLGLSPPDALERDSPGFVDYTDASGQPVAAASVVGVAFVRRWLVGVCTGCGGDGLVLRVLVIRADARLRGAPHHSRGAAILTTIKARRTW